MERRGHRFVRYADDCNIYVRSERAGQRVMESITRFITQKLKLKVNEAKSAVARPQERKFLGFSFTAGPEVKRVIAPKALDRFNALGPVATPGGNVAAVENTAPSQSRFTGTGGARAAGKQYRRQQSRPLVPREGEGLVCWAFERVLRLARPSILVRRTVGVTDSNRRVRTRMHGGAAGDRRPYADQTALSETMVGH